MMYDLMCNAGGARPVKDIVWDNRTHEMASPDSVQDFSWSVCLLHNIRDPLKFT